MLISWAKDNVGGVRVMEKALVGEGERAGKTKVWKGRRGNSGRGLSKFGLSGWGRDGPS